MITALLAAFAAAREKNPHARLVLVGDGPERADVQALCPDAILTGTQRGEALATHYASGDIFLFPSLTETFGNVTLEALASGLAVVAFDYAAAGETIFHGDNGLLARKGDTTAFSAQAAAAVTGPVHTARIRCRARETALGLGWDQAVRQLEIRLEIAAGMPVAPQEKMTQAQLPAATQQNPVFSPSLTSDQ